VRRVLRASGVVVTLAVGVAIFARVLMRLVTLDTSGQTRFSLVGTFGIFVLFLLSAIGAMVSGMVVIRTWVLILAVFVTSSPLWESDVAIGLSSFAAARHQPMTPVRWVGFWSLFLIISVLAALTPYTGIRVGRRNAKS
jgi:hypothetical protein